MKDIFKQKNKGREILSISKGFTLVETLVAISIFTISILALVAVLARGIANTTYAKDKIIATYLAQEGIEYMRNMRDTFVLYSDTARSQTGWDAFNSYASAPCQGANGCYLNADNLFTIAPPMPMSQIALTSCSGSGATGCPALLYDAVGGVYGYTTGVNSGFIRKIKVTPINTGGSVDEIRVSSTVYWFQGSGTYNVSFSESLFNWIQ